MALTTAQYSSYFRYDEATKQLRFTDSTDYSSQGTAAANVVITIRVQGPSGIFYNNLGNTGSPDIDPDVSLDSVNTIPLPLGLDGLPEQGNYVITLQYDDSVVGPTTITDTKNFTLNYSSPSIDIGMTVDCITPLLTATDNSAYTINSVAPTIVRDFKIHYPPSTPTPDVTGTAASLNTRVFYTVADSTVEHSSSLTSTLTYLFDVSNLIYVVDEVTGRDVIQVACNGDICDIYCCLRSQWQRYNSLKSSNIVESKKALAIFEQITSLASLVGNAIKCGKNDHISAYVAEILDLADCDAGCSCNDGEPQLVTGLAVNGNEVVVNEGAGVTVTSVDGGGTTTYTVSLSTVNVNKLAATYNSVVAAGTNTSVVSSSNTVGDVTTVTYNVNATDTVVESQLVRARLTVNSSSVPTLAIVNQSQYGSTFTAVSQGGGTDFLTNENASSFSDWQGGLTNFTVANFGTPGTTFFPEVSVANLVSPANGDAQSWANNLKANIVTMGLNTFSIVFSDANGNNVFGKTFQTSVTSIDLIFKIQA